MAESISNRTARVCLQPDHFGIKVFLFFPKKDWTRIFSFFNCTKMTSDWECLKISYKILTFKFYFSRSFSNSCQFTSF